MFIENEGNQGWRDFVSDAFEPFTRMLRQFHTKDIALMSVLATLNGVLTFYLTPLSKILTQFGGPIAASILTGLYMLYGVLGYYIIRKPGTGMMLFGFGAFVQSCVTPPVYGIQSVIIAAICYIIVIELVFAMLQYRVWSTPILMLVSGAMVPLWFYFACHLFGYTAWGGDVLAIALFIRIVSGVFLCGLLAKVIGDRLVKTGLLRGFAIEEHSSG